MTNVDYKSNKNYLVRFSDGQQWSGVLSLETIVDRSNKVAASVNIEVQMVDEKGTPAPEIIARRDKKDGWMFFI